jgi:peptide/nickel transport system substrate-binding protein
VLVRNPYFREWSQAAQPDGYPDRIELRLDVPKGRQIDAVLRGQADAIPDGVPPGRLRELQTQHAARTHVEPEPSDVMVILNTRVPPFDDVRVRRALNVGIDRRAVVRAIGGSAAGAPTCQILPPNFPGYVRYCPYGAPDLRRARRMVAASRTEGTRVVLTTIEQFAPVGQVVVALLRRLGYRSALRVIPNDELPEAYQRLFDSRSRTQAYIFLWAADYPAPSNFTEQLLSCAAFSPATPGNLNGSQFCSPAIDRLMRKAADAEAEDAGRAGRLWTRVDHALVDAAPWLPLYNRSVVALTGERVGGYRYHPMRGILLDQLWVR